VFCFWLSLLFYQYCVSPSYPQIEDATCCDLCPIICHPMPEMNISKCENRRTLTIDLSREYPCQHFIRHHIKLDRVVKYIFKLENSNYTPIFIASASALRSHVAYFDWQMHNYRDDSSKRSPQPMIFARSFPPQYHF
jgi:hypothetical protein